MTTAIQSSTVPEPIVRKLNHLIWRTRLVVALRGAMATLATAVFAVLAIMAIDFWVVIFSDWVRWALSMSGLGLTVLVALWFLVRPLARSFTLTGVARLIETRHPELHERISSTVELLTSKDAPELRGSDVLIAALAEEAVVDARAVRPSREIHFKAAFPYLLAAALVVGVLVSVIAIWPEQADRLFRRALMANVSRVSRTDLKITRLSAPDLIEWGREGVDYVLPAGQRLQVELEVSEEAVSSAELRKAPLEGGDENALSMTRLPDEPGRDRRFAIACPPATADFRFRIFAGDALTRHYRVRVVDKPAVSRIDLKYEYPEYTRRGVEERPSASGEVSAVAGTVVTITARTNKAVESAEFRLGDDNQPGQLSEGLDGSTICTFRVPIAKDMKTRWSARLKDRYGFGNEPTEYAVKALPDRRPNVNVSLPNTTRLKLKPTERVPVVYRVGDDFGLSGSALLVEIDGTARDPLSLPIPPGEKPVRRHEGQTALDLASLPLEGARQVTFRLRATDILPPELKGPQEGFSELFTIQLDVNAPSFTEQVVLAEELRMREVLQEVLKELLEAKKDSAPLRHMVPKAEAVTEAIAVRVDRMRGHLQKSDAMLRQLIDETVEGIYAGFSEKLTALVNNHVGKALDLAGQIKLTDKKKQRGALADEADFQVDRSIALVKELLKELGVLSEQIARAMELDQLAAEQEDLADALKDMLKPDANAPLPDAQAPAAPKDLEDWQKAQDKLAGQLAEMAKKTPGAVEAQLRQDTQRAKDLLAEARQLAREQRELQQDTAQATRLEQLEKAIEDLARKQEQLAKEAAGVEAAKDQAKPMTAAAEDLKAQQLEDAIGKQKAAEGELDRRAEKGADAKAAEDLAAQAERIAKEQQALAEKAAAARKGLEASEQKAQAAQKQATDAKKQAADATNRAAQQGATLQQKQQALAQKTRDMRNEAARNPASANEAGRTQPERAMDQAAQAAGQRNLDQAAQQAAAAQQQADQLAKDLDGAAKNAAKAAGSAPKDKQPPLKQQAQGAEKSAQQARQVADAQKDLAKEFAQAAEQGRSAQTDAQEKTRQAAADQQAAQQAAAQAKQQVASLSSPQRNLARQAEQLTRQAAKAGEKAQQAARQHDPTSEMKQAAQSMAASQQPQSADQARQAAEKAQQLAQALRQAGQEAPQAAKQQSPQLADMSRRQGQIRQETERLLGEKQRLEQAMAAKEVARLQREQAQLAQEAGRLADEVKKTAPQSDRIDTQAARSAQEAADELGRRDVAQAAEKATDAGQKLDELAQRLDRAAGRPERSQQGDSQQGDAQQGDSQQGDAQQGDSQQGDAQQGDSQQGKPAGEQVAAEGSTAQEPEAVGGQTARDMRKKAELADDAGDLGRRQGQLARQMKALAEGSPAAMLAAKQAAVGERTADLSEDVGRIQEHAEELIPEEAARREAAEAGRQLDAAEKAQSQAVQSLAAGKPSQAAGPEQQSTQALTNAAAALERLGRQLASAAAKQRSPEPAPESGDLADAYDSADQAADSAQPSDADLAAQQLSQLAQAVAARAQEMGMALGQMDAAAMAQRLSQASRSRDSKQGTSEQLTDLTAARLAQLGITLTDWARLPGQLRDQVLQAAGSQAPEEYRGLIQRYFREVARRGGSASDGETKD